MSLPDDKPVHEDHPQPQGVIEEAKSSPGRGPSPARASRNKEQLRSAPPQTHGSRTPGEIARHIQLAQEGDREAFSVLVDQYEGMVLRAATVLVGNASDAEDVAQEAFLKLYRHLARLDPGRDPSGWIYRITVRCSWDFLNRRRRQWRVQDELRREAEPGRAAPSPLRSAEADEVRAILLESLQHLPPRARAVFTLKEVEGLEVPEIATILRMARVTVRRHLSRARARLRKHLEGTHPELLGG